MKGANSSRYVIAAGDTLILHQSCLFFACSESSAPFEIQFENGEKLPFWAGAVYENTERMNNIMIRNLSATEPLIIVWIWGFGVYRDQSLKLMNDITAKQKVYSSLTCQEIVTPATVTVPAGTAEVMIQNIGAGDIRVGGEAGLKIEPGNDFKLNFAGDLEIAGSSTVVVARLS